MSRAVVSGVVVSAVTGVLTSFGVASLQVASASSLDVDGGVLQQWELSADLATPEPAPGEPAPTDVALSEPAPAEPAPTDVAPEASAIERGAR